MAATTIKPNMTMLLLENSYMRLHLDSYFDYKQSASNKGICKKFNEITLDQRIKTTGVFKVIEVMKREHFRLPSTLENGCKTLHYQSFERLNYSRTKVMEHLRATKNDIKIFDMSDSLIDLCDGHFFYIIGQKEFQELSSMTFPNVRNLVVFLPKPQQPTRVEQFEKDEKVLKLTREQIVKFAHAFPNVETLTMSDKFMLLGNYAPFSRSLEEDEIDALLSLPETEEESQISRLPKEVRKLTLAQCKHPYNEKFSKLLKGMRKLQSISMHLLPFTFNERVAEQMADCFKDLPLHSFKYSKDSECPDIILDQAFLALSKIRSLKSLELSSIFVTIEAMKTFASMPSLEFLETYHIDCPTLANGRPTRPYSVEGMKALKESKSLTALTMQFWGNFESEKLAAMVAELPKIPSLKILDFADYEIPRNFGESLAKCINLEELYIKDDRYPSISDEELGKLKDVPKLRKIVFGKEPYSLRFSNKGFEKLVQSKTLEILDIKKFEIIDVVAIFEAAKRARNQLGMRPISIYHSKLSE